MTERQWELYRLSVMKEAEESPHKAAVIRAIEHKLMTLDLEEKACMPPADSPSRSYGDIA
jgi:hypothetical protein